MVNKPSPYRVPWSYLPEQFADNEAILTAFREFVPTGDFTLGAALTRFETAFAQAIGSQYAIGVNSGTDAIKLSLKTLGVGPGDEVITAANTFIATIGAINEIGAIPVLVDCRDDFCLNVDEAAAKITRKTKAIVPVHLTGQMVDMPTLMTIAQQHNLPVIEDACQAMFSDINGKKSGTFGITGCFSLHPLKAINVWGDGGVILTDDPTVDQSLRLYRNHGLKNRDEVVLLGYNSRLDTLQAMVALDLLQHKETIINNRLINLAILDKGLKDIPQIRLPTRHPNRSLICHLYIIFAEHRNDLYRYCLEQGIEVKIHYSIPLYLQSGLKQLGYKKGDFPVVDRHTETMLSLPMHQHHTPEQMETIIDVIRAFYAKQ